jgi:ribonuclease Y
LALLASDLAKKIQAQMEYPGRIKVTVIRELRATDTAH